MPNVNDETDTMQRVLTVTEHGCIDEILLKIDILALVEMGIALC